CNLRDQSLQVSDRFEVFSNFLGEYSVIVKLADNAESFVDRRLILKWEDEPLTQLPRSHRCDSAIQGFDKGHTTLMLRLYDFKIPDRKLVQPDVFIFVDAGDRGDVGCILVFRLFEVMQDGSRGNDGLAKTIYSETLQACRVELPYQFFIGIII